MSFISASYSVKKLSDKRYTSENTLLATEAFVSPFDINAEEVYTDYRYIPTSSAGLPFSGSSQNLLIVSASNTDSSIAASDDLAVLKYWYRKKVKRGNQGGRSTFFFVEDDSFGANDAVFSDQLITSSQQTNFISPKYISATDAGNNTESDTPGYKIEVSVGANAGAATIVNNLTYAFDYKTGILSFFPNQTPSAVSNTSNFVFISAYQYVGRTLSSQIVDGTLGGGSGTGFPFSGSAVITGSLVVSASTPADTVDFTNIVVSGSTFSGSFVGNGSGLTGVIADSVDIPRLVSASVGALNNQIAVFKDGNYEIDGSTNLTFDGQTLTVSTASITTNLTVGGNLTVNGTTTTVNSTEIELGDRILILNAALAGGSGDAGIHVHVSASDGDPSAHTGSLLWDDDEKYWKGGELGAEVKFLRETGDGILSGSAQIASDISGSLGANASLIRSLTATKISGSFVAPSSSFSTRVTNLETNNTGTNTGDQDLTGLALKTKISGSFIAPSSSFSTRVTDLETNNTGTNTGDQDLTGLALKTEVSGAFVAPSSSFSTRVTDLETNNTGTNTGDQDLTGLALKTKISGSFVAPSSSFSTRVTSLETNNTGTNTGDQDLTGLALKTKISGSFVAPSSSFSTRVTALEANEVHTAAAISGAIDAATASLFSGTPLDNQVAVFTDHNTIEGSTNLTFDGQTLTVSTASITTNLTVGGNLTVSGTTTTVNSTVVEIGDNIIVLNSIDAIDTDGGINIHVSSSANTGVTASLEFDTSADYWVAGLSTDKKRIVRFDANDPTNNGFIHLDGSDNVVSVAQGVEGSFLQSDGDGSFTVSNVIDGGSY